MFSILTILSLDQGKLYGHALSEDEFYRHFAHDPRDRVANLLPIPLSTLASLGRLMAISLARLARLNA